MINIDEISLDKFTINLSKIDGTNIKVGNFKNVLSNVTFKTNPSNWINELDGYNLFGSFI